MNSSFRILRVRGIEIGANWSWLFIFGLIIWSEQSEFKSFYPGHAAQTYWTMAIISAVLFVTSLLMHELGHAFRAQKEGMEIDGITLWLFGGVARFKGMFPSAGAEFRIAIAGPLVTVVLGVLFAAMWFVLEAVGAPTTVSGVPNLLWQIQVILLVFNMIPALPLDGGRVLRSYYWWRRRDFALATQSAARVSRALSFLMVAGGALLFIAGYPQGLWFALIGYFVMQAGQAELSYAMVRHDVGSLFVRDVMTPNPETVVPSRTIESFINDVAHVRGHSTYPVVDLSGDLLGLISIRIAASVPFVRRGEVFIRDVMIPREKVAVLTPDTTLTDALAAIQSSAGRAVVMQDGRIAGILSMSDVARALELERIRTPGGAPLAMQGSRRRRTPVALWILFSIIALLAVGVFYSPPVVVLGPGAAFDVTPDIHIKGVKTDTVTGEYVLTSVSVARPRLIGLLGALANGREVAALSDVVPAQTDPDKYFKQQEDLFEQSEKISAAAAAKAAGMKVGFKGAGALVESLSAGRPAAKVLKTGDVITAVDGTKITLADQLVQRIRSRPVGSDFAMTVTRGKRTIQVHVRSASGIVKGAPGIGATLSTKDLDVNLPFEITFKKREIGGPSAGLVYALAVYDLITPGHINDGRIVATTGTMDLDGNVGPIGGVKEKAIAAKRAKAELFLVPQQELEGAKGSGLDVVGVSTLKDAIAILKSQRS